MRLIDLDEFLRQSCVDRIDGKSCEECKHHVLEVSCERLMEQPTIDAVEVVRCKNCRWWDKREGSNYGYCHAAKHGYYSRNWEISIYRTYGEDFFCGDGETREDDG